MKIGVSILTNGERRNQLQACLEAFIAGTDCSELTFALFDNGSTDDAWDWFQGFEFPDGVKTKFERSETDLGCAAGTNKVSEMVKDFEYVLHLESDFLLLPEGMTGEDDKWLVRALSNLKATGSDYLYLRRMVSPEESQAHWWAQWMPKVVQGTGTYMDAPGFWWSNNPHLRNNKAIYEAGCLPLDESKDGAKGTPGWSKPEMEAKRPQKPSIHRWGMFVHEQVPEGVMGPSESCNGSPGSVPWCKYGFFGLDGSQKFCETCDSQKGLEDLPLHEGRVKAANMPKFTVMTVDNGWTYSEFERMTKGIPNVTRLLVAKGAAGIPSTKDVEVVPFEDLGKAIKRADAALFCKIGDANRAEYEKILKAGVPVVIHVDHHQGLIDHQKNGFFFADESWATYWLMQLYQSKELRKEIKQTWKEMGGRRDSMLTYAEVAKGCPSCAEKMKKKKIKAVKREVVEKELDKKPTKVTVVTPTWKRDPKIIRRAIDCMTLQTVTEWEQLVCSNGPEEMEARSAVESARDVRVRYRSLNEECPEGDFGNSARKHMIEEARGEYIMFLDDDNVIMPDYLEKMVKALEDNPDAGFAVCRVMHFGPLNEEALGKPPIVLEGEPVKLYHIDPLQVMVRKKVMQEVGWDTEKGYLSDGVTLEKLGKAASYSKIEEVLGVHI